MVTVVASLENCSAINTPRERRYNNSRNNGDSLRQTRQGKGGRKKEGKKVDTGGELRCAYLVDKEEFRVALDLITHVKELLDVVSKRRIRFRR